MTRAKLEKAIQMGMRRGAGQDVPAQISAVADAIEMAIEWEQEGGGSNPGSNLKPEPAKVVDWPIEAPKPVLPPSPAAIPEKVSAERTTPAAVRHIQAAAADPITLEQLIDVLNKLTPEQLSMTIEFPERGPVPVVLQRNVTSDFLSGSARLIYKHPKAPDGIEAGVVYLAVNGVPDLNAGMNQIEQIAAKVYGPRTQSPPVAVHEYSGPVIESLRVGGGESSMTIPGMEDVPKGEFPGGFKLNI